MSVVKSTYKYIFYPLATLVCIITLLILIQPTGATYRIFTNSAVEIMLGILGFGMLCMLLQWHRLMFVSFTCVGILSLFLKSSSNPSPVYARPIIEKDMEVLHFNISSYEGSDYNELADLVLTSDADIISIQEVTPDWDSVFQFTLRDSFPFSSSVASIGFNGMAVYSKHQMFEIDTFYYRDIPNLTGLVLKKNTIHPIRFISTYTNPAFNTDKFYQEMKDHFDTIIEKVKDSPHPKLAFGTYNTVAWSSEMQYFANKLGLQNSRRSTNPFSQGTYEHIFHSLDMECVDFGNFYDKENNKLGQKVKLHLKDMQH